MSRTLRALLAGTMLLAMAGTSQAQWASDFFSSFGRDFKRNNHWPAPFVGPDREAVCLPFEQMVNNGWRKQNLITEYHFEEDSTRLTQAGQLKVRWILTQVPPRHRTIFVQRGDSIESTTSRVDAVQQAAVRMVPAGDLPEVVESNLTGEGMPAEDIDRTMTNFQKTAISPRLPAAAGSSGGGAGASGGGGSN